MAIQRWAYAVWQDGPLEESDDGEWVRYKDHISEIDRRDEINALRLRIEQLEAGAMKDEKNC